MQSVLACRLLGFTTFVFHATASEAAPAAVVRVWPPGSDVYLGESVVLQCSVTTAAAAAPGAGTTWTYRWFRHPSPDPPRHLASRDAYAITGATAEDGGEYWCRAEGPGPGPGPGVNSTAVRLLSERVRLNVSGTAPPLLSVSPSSLQFFRGDNLTVRCPDSVSNPTAWRLRQLSQDLGVRTWDLQAGLCSPPSGGGGGGGVGAARPDGCVFAGLSSGNSGLYWCEGDAQRSNAVSITVVTNATVVLQSPYLVSEGDRIVLHCRFWKGDRRMATFFRDGVAVATGRSAHPQEVIGLAMENATKAQEGFYKCASLDRTMESPESWLSVKCNSTWTDWPEVSNHGTWRWSIVSSVAATLLVSMVPIVWLIHRWRRKRRSKAEVPNTDAPATKQDATEVQWDLSWMEMSNLLDKP